MARAQKNLDPIEALSRLTSVELLARAQVLRAELRTIWQLLRTVRARERAVAAAAAAAAASRGAGAPPPRPPGRPRETRTRARPGGARPAGGVRGHRPQGPKARAARASEE